MSQTGSQCFHCNLEIPPAINYPLHILGQDRNFCCPGCQAIAETICKNGLQDFYRFRSGTNNRAEKILPQELLDIEVFDNQSILKTISKTDNNLTTVELGIEGITCAACGWLIKKQIGQRPEVTDIQVNTTTRRATLSYNADASLSDILKNIRQLGYSAFPFSEDQQEQVIQKEDKAYIRRLIIAGLATMQVMMFATGLYIGDFQDISSEHAYFLHLVSALITTPVVAYSAFPFFINAWNGLKHAHFGMDLPVSIAIISGFSASLFSLVTQGSVYYFDSVVMFTFFLLLGRYLEHRMRLKAILRQQSFNKLLPWSATRRNKDESTSVIPVNDINIDDEIIINAGTVVPVDGLLLDKSAELNQAVISGESMPVQKTRHEKLYSGSYNNSSSFTMKATSTVRNSRLQKLIQLQDDTETLSSNIVSLADKIANIYVIALLGLTVVTGIIWWQIDPSQIFPVVLSLLVVSCPCALSLATPTAVAAAIASFTDKGLMIKSREALSNMNEITDIYFDKTGTLTSGKMSLAKVYTHTEEDENTCIRIAACLESISNHPVATAFSQLEVEPISNMEKQEVLSRGITGKKDNDIYTLGKPGFATSDKKPSDEESIFITPDSLTRITLFLTKNNCHIATFILTDEIAADALTAVNQLKQRYEITLLSGDSQQASQDVANKLDIQSVISNVTPEQKLQQVASAQKAGKKVLMVGDGVNDIGALNKADVGITMGNATHLSKSSSDAVLVSSNLTVISEALTSARQLKQVIFQNISWAIVYNLTAIPFAMAGLIPAWLAAIGMTGSSLIVVLNALRLRNQ